MRHSVGAGRVLSYARWLPFVGGRSSRAQRRWQLTISTTAGVAFCLAMALSAMTAKAVAANSDDASFSALRDYVQSVATTTDSTDTQKSDQDVSKSTSRESDDGAYAALRDFARRIGDKQPPSINGAQKLAAADTLIDFLRGLQNGNQPNSTAPAQMPAAKTSRSDIPAHYVGSKVCATCHADKIAEFKKTLMGKIGMTAKGRASSNARTATGRARSTRGSAAGAASAAYCRSAKTIRDRLTKETPSASTVTRRVSALTGPAAFTRRAGSPAPTATRS